MSTHMGAPEGVTETLPAAGLRQMVAKTQFAITGEDTRFFLNGGLLVLKADSMSLVATDGHRLALVTVPRETGEPASRSRARQAAATRVVPRSWKNCSAADSHSTGCPQPSASAAEAPRRRHR